MDTKKRIKILFVLISLEPGGGEKLVLDLASHLDAEKFEAFVAYFHDGTLRLSFEKAGVKLCPIKKNRGIDPRSMIDLAKIISSTGVNIVNSHHFMPFVFSFLGTKIFHRRKLIYTEHSKRGVQEIKGFWHYAARILFERTDLLIGVSPEVSTALIQKYRIDRSKVMTVRNGVDTGKFTRINNGLFRREMGFSDQDYVIANVSNFRRIKNHKMLIQAFSKVLNRLPYCKLLLIGQGFPKDPENTEEEMRELVKSLKLERSVRFLGYRDDVSQILGDLDLFCLTSIREGLPLSVLEAMSAGVPVVATDVEGLKDVIRNGENGLLVPLNDLEALACAIESLLLKPSMRLSLAVSARKVVEENHSIEKCVKEFEECALSLFRIEN